MKLLNLKFYLRIDCGGHSILVKFIPLVKGYAENVCGGVTLRTESGDVTLRTRNVCGGGTLSTRNVCDGVTLRTESGGRTPR